MTALGQDAHGLVDSGGTPGRPYQWETRPFPERPGTPAGWRVAGSTGPTTTPAWRSRARRAGPRRGGLATPGARRRRARAGGRRRGHRVDRRLDRGRGAGHRRHQPRVPRGRPQRGPRPGAGAAAVGGPTAGGPGAAARPRTTARSVAARGIARAGTASRRPAPPSRAPTYRSASAARSSTPSPCLEGGDGVEHPGDERARIGRRGRDEVEQPLLAEPPGRARGVRQAVGEEQQRVAAAQRAGHLGALRAGHGAQQQAVTADRLDRAARLDAERQRVAAGGQRHGDAVGGLAQYRADHGHERELVPLAQGLVDDVEHGGGLVVVAGGRLGRMAHERRQRGGLDPLAGDVAHEDHQAAVDREDVVEVAADLGLRDARGGTSPRAPSPPAWQARRAAGWPGASGRARGRAPARPPPRRAPPRPPGGPRSARRCARASSSRARALSTASVPARVTSTTRTTWSVLKRKPFQAPLAMARARARTATGSTCRGPATVASASGAST